MFKMLKENWIEFLLILLFLLVSSALEGDTVRVRGYYREDGTYVRPYTRKRPYRKRARKNKWRF